MISIFFHEENILEHMVSEYALYKPDRENQVENKDSTALLETGFIEI